MKLKEKISFTTTFEKGVIKQTQQSVLHLLRYDPTKIVVTVEPVKNKRSLSQNAWYHGIIIPLISEYSGDTHEAMDRFFERKFAPRYTRRILGEDCLYIKHCKEMSTVEFTEYVERIRAFVADFGIAIPDPDPRKSTTRLDA